MRDLSTTFLEALSRKFFEARLTVIIGVFIGVGSTVTLYIKAQPFSHVYA